jgi:hypothetical protein
MPETRSESPRFRDLNVAYQGPTVPDEVLPLFFKRNLFLCTHRVHSTCTDKLNNVSQLVTVKPNPVLLT